MMHATRALRLTLTLSLLAAVVTMPATAQIFETALPDGRLLQTFELPDYQCFQPNPQYGAIDGNDGQYVFGDWGNHLYSVIFPVNYDFDEAPEFPVLIYLLGGGFAWVDNQVVGEAITLPGQSWGTVTGTGQHSGGFALLSTQWWNQKKLISDFLYTFVEELPPVSGNPNDFLNFFRANYPDWGILYPSYCSRDIYTGTGQETEDSRRWGFQAVVDAVNFLESTYDVEDVLLAGNSAGGIGAAILATDLEDYTNVDVMGALVSSGPAEVAAWGEIQDRGATTNGFIQIETDDGQLAWFFCSDPNHDTTRGLGVAGIPNYSMREAIEQGDLDVPIYHLWGKRDQTNYCADLKASEESFDRAIADAIDENQPGDGYSINDEVCLDERTACLDVDPPAHISQCQETVQIPCTRHGLLTARPGNQDHFLRIADWIDTLVALDDEDDQGEDEDPGEQ